MPKNINLTGTSGATYNLDELSTTNTRTNSTEKLIVQIWEWNPNLPETNIHHYPNPSKLDSNGKVVNDLETGQIWLSKLVELNSERYMELLNGAE